MSYYTANWSIHSFDELNEYNSKTINPADYPNEEFELYSVPIFPTGKPEILKGSAIGSTKQVVEPDDVLVCKINPRINRVWKVGRRQKLRQIASSEWIILRAPALHSDYLRRFFSGPSFRELLCADLTGVGGSLTRAQPKRVAHFEIPLPPIPEQKRIADKLEAVLGRVDACRARLARVPDLLKRFRQSVLAAATSGRLTEDWRKENSADEYKPTTVGDLADLITKGASPKWQGISYTEKGPQSTLFVTSENVRAYKMDLTEPKFVEATFNKKQKRSMLSRGDILTNIVGASIGRSAIYDSGDSANINQAVCLIRMPSEVNRNFILTVLNAPNTLSFMNLEKVDVARANLSLKDIANIPVDLPSKAEQDEIVRRVETLFAFADRIEARLSEAQTTIDRLTPSTLAKAFRGELVPQDPADEPAAALLERIRQERHSSSPSKRSANRRVSTIKLRAPKQKSIMTKSRFDEDVKGKAYLAGLLRNAQTPMNAEELFKLSELPLVDFYKQLAWEVQKGHINDDRSKLEAAT